MITQEERDEIVRAAFHEAWGRAHDLPGYDKAAWSYVQRHLDPSYNRRPVPTATSAKP